MWPVSLSVALTVSLGLRLKLGLERWPLVYAEAAEVAATGAFEGRHEGLVVRQETNRLPRFSSGQGRQRGRRLGQRPTPHERAHARRKRRERREGVKRRKGLWGSALLGVRK